MWIEGLTVLWVFELEFLQTEELGKQSQTGLLYRTVMPWLEGSPFGLSLTLASLLCWSRGQPIALYIVPFSVIGISSMLWKEPWSRELGSRSCQSIHLSLGHLWNGDQNSFSICGPLQWCEVRWDNECQKHFVSCKVQSKWERLAFLLYKWDLSFLGSSCCCLVTESSETMCKRPLIWESHSTTGSPRNQLPWPMLRKSQVLRDFKDVCGFIQSLLLRAI